MLLEQSKYKGTGTTTSFSFVMQHFDIIICDQIPCLPYFQSLVCVCVCVCVCVASHVLTVILYVNIIIISQLKETAMKVEPHRSPNVNSAYLKNKASYCYTDTTPTQPHRNSNTHRNKNTRPMWWYNRKVACSWWWMY